MATGSMPRAAMLGVSGAASGVAAWAMIVGARKLGVQIDTAMTVAPGLVFGLILGAHFAARRQLAAARLVGYWLASGIAYYGAYHVAYHLVAGGWLGDGVGALAAAGIAAGFCGSALLALLSVPLLRVDAAPLRLSVAVGALTGALLPLITIEGPEVLPGLLAFFVLWQSAYAASLAPVTRHPAA